MTKWLIGFHSVEETIKSGVKEATLYIAVKGNRAEKLIRLAQKKEIPFRTVNRKKIQALTGNKEVRDCAIQIFDEEQKNNKEMKKKKYKTLEEFLETIESENIKNSTVLILDRIIDPHNLGAMLRSADQFKVDCVIIPDRNSAQNSVTVMKTSAGAARYVQLFNIPNLSRTIDLLKKYDFWVYGADINGKPLHKEKITNRSVIIMGNEGKGMRQLTKEKCDSILSIQTEGNIDSLNVSVACGIILHHIFSNQP